MKFDTLVCKLLNEAFQTGYESKIDTAKQRITKGWISPDGKIFRTITNTRQDDEYTSEDHAGDLVARGGRWTPKSMNMRIPIRYNLDPYHDPKARRGFWKQQPDKYSRSMYRNKWIRFMEAKPFLKAYNIFGHLTNKQHKTLLSLANKNDMEFVMFTGKDKNHERVWPTKTFYDKTEFYAQEKLEELKKKYDMDITRVDSRLVRAIKSAKSVEEIDAILQDFEQKSGKFITKSG
jgi:hypothetical protein